MHSDSAKSAPVKRIAIAIEMDHAYPWHHDCYQGILQYGQSRGWQCVVDPFLFGASEEQGDKPYDGVVGRITSEVAELAQTHSIPVVNHWSKCPAEGLPSVLIDEFSAGRLAGEHLMACGYRHFAFMGLESDLLGHGDLEGLTQAVTSKGFLPPDSWGYNESFEEDRQKHMQFRDGLRHWLSDLTLPVGILTTASSAVRYLTQICDEIDRSVPQDVGIIVQSADISSDTGSPSITSVELDFLRVGFEAARLLDTLMMGNPSHPLQRLVAPKRLIARDSTDVFLCDDPLVKEAMVYISEHCRKPLKVEDVADALHTSESTLRRRFEKSLDRQVRDEIVRQRTNYIKAMLAETDKPMATISIECGFSSPTQFARYFSSATGMTPSAYRKQNGADA